MLTQKKCCIDSCVWVKYAGHFKTATLLRYIAANNLLVYADNYLLSEIHDALIEAFDFTVSEADKIIQLISPFIIIEAPVTFLGYQKMQRIIICMTYVYKIIVVIL